MKILNSNSNLNSKLPLFVIVWKIENDIDSETAKSPSPIDCHFSMLKKNNFQISETNFEYQPDSNYSNFLLSKIELSDFQELNPKELYTLLKLELSAWWGVYKAMDSEELKWFIDITYKQIEVFAREYEFCKFFNLPPKKEHAKRHPYFTLFDFFLSLIFYNTNGDINTFAYSELSYR